MVWHEDSKFCHRQVWLNQKQLDHTQPERKELEKLEELAEPEELEERPRQTDQSKEAMQLEVLAWHTEHLDELVEELAAQKALYFEVENHQVLPWLLIQKLALGSTSVAQVASVQSERVSKQLFGTFSVVLLRHDAVPVWGTVHVLNGKRNKNFKNFLSNSNNIETFLYCTTSTV